MSTTYFLRPALSQMVPEAFIHLERLIIGMEKMNRGWHTHIQSIHCRVFWEKGAKARSASCVLLRHCMLPSSSSSSLFTSSSSSSSSSPILPPFLSITGVKQLFAYFYEMFNSIVVRTHTVSYKGGGG